MSVQTHKLIPRIVALLAVASVAVAGCTSGDGAARDDQLVLAEGYALTDYNPLLGYGQLGVSPIYEGLLRPEAADDTRVPNLVPALAAEPPQQVAPRTWRVPLRADVTFSDGSALDAEDVLATYRAVADPAVAAPIATSVAPIVEMSADGDDAVTVRMATDADPSPYLLLGIVPAESVEDAPAADWALNTAPVGTGPYRLDELRPDQAILVAREDYWGSTPQVQRIVYSYVPDDNARAQRIRAGEADGANLPPALVDSLAEQDDVTTHSVKSADWRGVSLPSANPFTADPSVRLAMNLGVDRAGIVENVLRGYGEVASTPIASVYGDIYDPSVQYELDVGRAGRLLDEAGWTLTGGAEVRSKDGARAAFPLLYNAQDTLRRDLAVAFAAAMSELGIEVTPRGTSWDDIDTQLDTAAVLLGGGDTPYSLDAQVYDTLHTRVPGSSPYANPGNFTAPGMDELLDAARAAGPEAAGARYRELQRIYVEQPSQVFLAFLHHTYVDRSAGWTHPEPILEPHSHGVAWGPWWNLAAWQRE